jgi:hypothetical protein
VLSKKIKYEEEDRVFETEWEEQFVLVERNQIKYSVLKIEHY